MRRQPKAATLQIVLMTALWVSSCVFAAAYSFIHFR
jgi:hypothetical protein